VNTITKVPAPVVEPPKKTISSLPPKKQVVEPPLPPKKTAPVVEPPLPPKKQAPGLFDVNTVNCPFFATMLNQQALESKAVYNRFELFAFSQAAGVPRNDAILHTEGNFLNVPTGMMDLFNMEGNPNEHQTSTGIIDCPSPFPATVGDSNSCTFDAIVGNIVCRGMNPDSPPGSASCRSPERSRQAFDLFFAAADITPTDGLITFAELMNVETLFNKTVGVPGQLGQFGDITDGSHLSPPGKIEGAIAGATDLIIKVFGETCTTISRSSLEDVFLRNIFPPGYRFPSDRICPSGVAAQIADGTPFDIGVGATVGQRSIESVNCPFLATMIHQGALENKPVYARFELQTLSIAAGVAEVDGELHTEGNFMNVPTEMMDLFDMEGNPNEHQTSTGIIDCPSPFPSTPGGSLDSCQFDKIVGNLKCTPNIPGANGLSCRSPERSRQAFDTFINAADVSPNDGFLTPGELLAAEALFNQTVAQNGQLGQFGDVNDGGHLNNGAGGVIEGAIAGSFVLLIEVFGETCFSISTKALEAVFLENKFPAGYRFPSARICPPQLMLLAEGEGEGGGPPFSIDAVADGSVSGPTGVNDGAAATPRDLDAVICPFFRTMLATGSLEVKPTYTREELQEFSEASGLPIVDAELHTEGNFLNVPSGVMDLFDMEGNPNEHQTSTGISDCPTPFPATVGNNNNCQFFDPILQQLKCTPSTPCVSPQRSRSLFDLFITAADISPKDGILTFLEAVAAEALFNPTNFNQSALAGESDVNLGEQFNNGLPGIIEGAIGGSFILLMEVFGETCTSIRTTSLENIFLENKFPPNYRFPSARICGPGISALIGAEGEGEAALATLEPNSLTVANVDPISGGLNDVTLGIANAVSGPRSVDTVTCPFLATMINTAALENKAIYTRFELFELSVAAGVPRKDAVLHTEGNFLNVPTAKMDLFDMEGNPNEHQTSTGILDCPSPFPATVNNSNSCQFDTLVGNIKCTGMISNFPPGEASCRSPARSRRAFDLFFDAADILPTDGIITQAELNQAQSLFNQTVGVDDQLGQFGDINDGSHLLPPGLIEGAIGGAFDLIIKVFGETCASMSRSSFETVFLDNIFPSGYRFPSDRICPPGLPAQIADGTPFDIGVGPQVSPRTIDTVNCPFLATMINQGALENKPVYPRFELQTLSIAAGVAEVDAELHTEGNFMNVPTAMMDLFDMEGNPNEHQTSTGIIDCPSPFPSTPGGSLDSCQFDKIVGALKCTPNIPGANGLSCRSPERSRQAFDTFINAADVSPNDGFLTPGELLAAEALFNQTVAQNGQLGQFGDINNGGHLNNGAGGVIEGAIAGSFVLLIEVFGETCFSISTQALEAVFLENKFPPSYRFPSSRTCPPQLMGLAEGEGEGGAAPFQISAVADGADTAPTPSGMRDLDAVICPFLRTMLATGSLAVKPVYTREELQELSEQSGVPTIDAELHTEGNFLNVPSGKIDLFDMEGNPNEHQTSTGVSDCPTPFPATVGNNNACQFF
jgi:hypothetical protein